MQGFSFPASFMFPGTAALMLRQHSWAGDVAITSALRNYGQRGEEFWLKSRRRDSHHWHLVPVAGGWLVSGGPLPDAHRRPNVEPPF